MPLNDKRAFKSGSYHDIGLKRFQPTRPKGSVVKK